MLPPLEEAEIRVMIKKLYKEGGASAVWDCFCSMVEASNLVMKVLRELEDDKE